MILVFSIIYKIHEICWTFYKLSKHLHVYKTKYMKICLDCISCEIHLSFILVNLSDFRKKYVYMMYL